MPSSSLSVVSHLMRIGAPSRKSEAPPNDWPVLDVPLLTVPSPFGNGGGLTVFSGVALQNQFLAGLPFAICPEARPLRGEPRAARNTSVVPEASPRRQACFRPAEQVPAVQPVWNSLP